MRCKLSSDRAERGVLRIPTLPTSRYIQDAQTDLIFDREVGLIRSAVMPEDPEYAARPVDG
jgi:hypothetical protein